MGGTPSASEKPVPVEGFATKQELNVAKEYNMEIAKNEALKAKADFSKQISSIENSVIEFQKSLSATENKTLKYLITSAVASVATIIGILIALLAYGGDRFDGGMGVPKEIHNSQKMRLESKAENSLILEKLILLEKQQEKLEDELKRSHSPK